jgi:hypothetical protein
VEPSHQNVETWNVDEAGKKQRVILDVKQRWKHKLRMGDHLNDLATRHNSEETTRGKTDK